MQISLSESDKQRFGIVTAKVNLDADDDLSAVLAWCAENSTEMLIARVPTDQIALVQAMETAGFFLTDALVYFRKKKIVDEPINLPEGYSWRAANSDDSAAVGALAGTTFGGYSGHYHADLKLNKLDCDRVYTSWAANSCRDKQLADTVILITKEQEIAAFATMKQAGGYMCEGVLSGVSPVHQGKSLYQALLGIAQNWAIGQSYTQMIVSTQVTNLTVQKAWCRQGFEPHKSFYTFHKWFK